MLDQASHVLEQGRNVAGLLLVRTPIGREKTIDQGLQAVRLFSDDRGALAVVVARERAFEELRRTSDAAQRIFDLMREVPKKIASRGARFRYGRFPLDADRFAHVERFEKVAARLFPAKRKPGLFLLTRTGHETGCEFHAGVLEKEPFEPRHVRKIAREGFSRRNAARGPEEHFKCGIERDETPRPVEPPEPRRALRPQRFGRHRFFHGRRHFAPFGKKRGPKAPRFIDQIEK